MLLELFHWHCQIMSNAICVLGRSGRDLTLYDASLLKIKYLVFSDLWNSVCKDIGRSKMRAMMISSEMMCYAIMQCQDKHKQKGQLGTLQQFHAVVPLHS